MRLDLTLLVRGRPPLDVAVEAECGTSLSEVAGELARVAGRAGAEFFDGSRRLPGRALLGGPGLRSGCVLGVGAPGPRDRAVGAVLELQVVGGPDAGAVHPLSRGVVLVGRSEEADVTIADADVSRRHLAIAVTGDGITVHDTDSTNGTSLDGVPVGARPVSLTPGQLIRIGESSLTVAVPADPPAAVRPGDDGTLIVHRPPRLSAPTTEAEIAMPAEPARRTPGKVPLLGAALPLLAGIGLAVALHSAAYLAFAALSPVMVLGTAIGDRWGFRRGRRRDLADHRAACARADDQIARAVIEDARRRRTQASDLAVVRRAAIGPGQRLWERRRVDDDRLVLRLGTADRPAQVRVTRPAGHTDPPPAPTAPSVPVTVDLRHCGVLGVAGPRPPVEALLRSLVGQLATQHGPPDLGLVLLADDENAEGWSWLRWLPHLAAPGGGCRVGATEDQRRRRIAELLRLLDGRFRDAATRGGLWSGASVVLLIDRASVLRAIPGVARLLADGPGSASTRSAWTAVPVCCRPNAVPWSRSPVRWAPDSG